MKPKNIIKGIGMAGFFGTFLTFFITFVGAYSTPEKSITIYLGKEAHVEFALLLIFLFIFCYLLIQSMEEIAEEELEDG